MALRVITAAFTNKAFAAEPSSTILAGMVVAIEASTAGTPELARADRKSGGHAVGAIIGLAADDAYNVGNTMVIVDPVTLAYTAVPARKASDYKDETITVRSNVTDTGTTGRRGCTVMSVGGEFATDMYSSTYSASGANADSTATVPVTTVNAAYTYGVSTTTSLHGYLVYENSQVSTGILARVTDGVSGGLLFIRWVGV